jgi:hypothetical protein
MIWMGLTLSLTRVKIKKKSSVDFNPSTLEVDAVPRNLIIKIGKAA